MKKILFGKNILFGAALVLLFSGAAEANTFVWKDDVHGFTIAFPDDWTMQTRDVPATQVRIAGPVGADFATCRVQTKKDGRLKVYPKHLMKEAVDATLDRNFWENEVAEYDGAWVTRYRAPVKLGDDGDATAIRVSFVQESGTGKMSMYGEMIGSIYGDTRYIVSCSSKSNEFEQYAPVFAQIMGSVGLDQKYHPYATGYYRDFLADAK